jgi:regulator of sirC expression with transglutaminase-like and TPR domain
MAEAPRYCRQAAYELFREQLSTIEETSSLVKAAIAVSMHELDDVNPAAVDQKIRDIAVEISGRVCSGNPRALLAQLHEVLFEELAFSGNTDDYYDPANSYIPSVLESRRGIPVTLSLVYKSVAQQIGLAARGINAPAHFLAGVEIDGTWMIVDPFDGGRVLTTEEVYERLEKQTGTEIERSDKLLATATHPQWIARLIRNLEQIFERQDRKIDMLAMQELLALVKDADG